MTDRRPLGSGPMPAEPLPAPRAQLAAARLPAAPAAEQKPCPTAGRRALGAGPAALGGDAAVTDAVTLGL